MENFHNSNEKHTLNPALKTSLKPIKITDNKYNIFFSMSKRLCCNVRFSKFKHFFFLKQLVNCVETFSSKLRGNVPPGETLDSSVKLKSYQIHQSPSAK